MLINISDFKDGIIPLDFNETITLPEAYSAEGNVSLIHLRGEMSKNDGFCALKARMDTEVKFYCALCLVPTVVQFEASVEEAFSDTPEVSEVFWGFNGNIIDITPALLSNILLNLPMKVLCSDDCKGLCSVCGKDRNLSDCSCNESSIDPRWMALFEKEV